MRPLLWVVSGCLEKYIFRLLAIGKKATKRNAKKRTMDYFNALYHLTCPRGMACMSWEDVECRKK